MFKRIFPHQCRRNRVRQRADICADSGDRRRSTSAASHSISATPTPVEDDRPSRRAFADDPHRLSRARAGRPRSLSGWRGPCRPAGRLHPHFRLESPVEKLANRTLRPQAQ